MQLTSREQEMAGRQVWWLGVQQLHASLSPTTGIVLTGPLAYKPTCHCRYLSTRNQDEYMYLLCLLSITDG